MRRLETTCDLEFYAQPHSRSRVTYPAGTPVDVPPDPVARASSDHERILLRDITKAKPNIVIGYLGGRLRALDRRYDVRIPADDMLGGKDF